MKFLNFLPSQIPTQSSETELGLEGKCNRLLIAICFVLAMSIFLSCGSSSGEKNNFDPLKKGLLDCQKHWNSRTESEKVIGCWTSEPEEMKGSGKSGRVHGALNYQLIFYSDGSMDDVSYFTISFTKNDPLVYKNSNYKIEDGLLSYNYNGDTLTHPISIYEDHIGFLGRVYNKTSCF